MSKTGFISPAGGMSKTTVLSPSGGSKTRIELPNGGKAFEGQAGSASNREEVQPVVGWLVVISGPGAGKSRELTFGLNSIGRGGSNQVSLDFGDNQISTDDHFRIAYDDRNKSFLVSVGAGRNLVYIGDQPVLDARQLENGTELSVGDTMLKFVSLCGADWSWQQDD